MGDKCGGENFDQQGEEAEVVLQFMNQGESFMLQVTEYKTMEVIPMTFKYVFVPLTLYLEFKFYTLSSVCF